MVAIELSEHEALVLFDALAREIDDNKSKRLACVIDHPAEFWALNAVHCELERNLAEPFADNYSDLVARSRERLMDRYDPERSFGPIGGRD